MIYRVTLAMRSYIAEPYWPELDDVIQIRKKSGVDRARSEAKREAALAAYLERERMTMVEYNRLVELSQRKWYRNDDGAIIIPRHHLAGCLVQTVGTAPKPVRKTWTKDSFRSEVQLTDLVTDKTKTDTLFDRYVKSDLTNQRRRTISEVIESFEAVGYIECDDDVNEDDLKGLINYGLRNCGVGACRKMGYGRGKIQRMVPSVE